MSPCPILMYHWFRTGAEPSRSRSPQLEVSPDDFAMQMGYLKDRGYRSVSLREARAGQRGRERTVVITFDDGTSDFWDHARPTLEACGFTATLFIVTDFVGGESSWDAHLGEPARPLLTWAQIGELHEAGFEIGSHTRTHRDLRTLSDDEALAELSGSRDKLAEQLGTAPAYLAYPRGDYERRHQRLARDAGYSGACAVLLTWRDALRRDEFAINRVTVKNADSEAGFRRRLRQAEILCH